MNLHHRLNSSKLLILLQQWARDNGERALQLPQSDVAEQLGRWMSTLDAVKLSRALHAIESLDQRAGPVRPQESAWDALDQFVQNARADMTVLFTAIPKPLRVRADKTPIELPVAQAGADFKAHIPRYLDLQKQMDTRVTALRTYVRRCLAKGSVALRQLAALDEVMEHMLGASEQRLWAALPGHLERRMSCLHQKQQQALQAHRPDETLQRWNPPSGWPSAFEQDLQALLLAEMQVRLEPITGLLEAAHNEKTGRQE